MKDAQRVASRVQHHFHKKTKTGYVPLPRTCITKRSAGKCKHGFPMLKRINDRMRVVCRGNAKKFGFNVTGRRNALGLPINIRSCPWQTGTHPAFIRTFRSNSHTAPNYRLPLHPAYHDNEVCQANCLDDKDDIKNEARLHKGPSTKQRDMIAAIHSRCSLPASMSSKQAHSA